jgi:peptidoglycan L-alanyl-D-glutamate endopeptidase CwlK
MAKFSAVSLARLAGAHPLLQKIMHAALGKYDFTILQSQRGRADQEKAFRAGNTHAHFGQSAHNWDPAIALDVAPWPIDWNDRGRFIALNKVIGCFDPATGYGYGIAKDMKVPLRWGGDWNFNGILTDEHLVDLPHYELHPWREWAKHSKPFRG